ncbi:prostaglandin E synthase-like [Chiloscyllium plagiosum]|uniref:prostaglandin E synthase-like n=1 Tax=Chiloscyllium plagiosum TaxID=36176 RepID=UPI001CB8370C|nr:prostaglandin E synthase-like [Chiloscyllium plagiosum]
MILNLTNEVFCSFVFYAVLLLIKMFALAVLTGQVRLRKKAFANPEDALRHGDLKLCRTDPDVERCRRAHRNDMECIYPFLFLGVLYCFLDPSPSIARIHFRIFFLARLLHTVAYLFALKAPTRSLAYTLGQIPCFSMALKILINVASYW